MKILMVEDDADTRAGLCDVLEEDGHSVESAATLAEVFLRDDLPTFSVILLDRKLPDGTADRHLPRLKTSAPGAAIIVMTGYADLDAVIEAIHHGAVDFIIKPIHPERLKLRLKRMVELREAEDRVSRAERLAAIGQMLAVLSHESRNVLQCISGGLEILALEVEDRPAALDLVRRIEKAQDRLHQLFEDLRGYAAPIVIHRDVHNVSDTVLDAWNSLLSLQRDRVVRLKGIADGDPVYCAVDRSRLEQVFRNIFENALAACADPVEITWRVFEARVEDEHVVLIVLEDNGPGLSDEQQQRIFDPFYTTKSNGTGLGMAICKRIVEAHAGQIAAESVPGRGAKFVITLPNVELARRANRAESPHEIARHNDVHISCGACR